MIKNILISLTLMIVSITTTIASATDDEAAVPVFVMDWRDFDMRYTPMHRTAPRCEVCGSPDHASKNCPTVMWQDQLDVLRKPFWDDQMFSDLKPDFSNPKPYLSAEEMRLIIEERERLVEGLYNVVLKPVKINFDLDLSSLRLPKLDLNNLNVNNAVVLQSPFERIKETLKGLLNPVQLASIPADFDPAVYADIYHNWVAKRDEKFQMDELTFATFFYANWVLKNPNPKRVLFKVSPKNVPADFDAAKYLTRYSFVAEEAALEMIEPVTYAKAHYLHYKDLCTLDYK